MIRGALFTGSRVYGTPREGSDLDLILWLDQEDIEELLLETPCSEKGSEVPDENQNGFQISIKFGYLNVIAVTTREAYDCWKKGTAELKGHAPVSREKAVKTLSALRKKAGISK